MPKKTKLLPNIGQVTALIAIATSPSLSALSAKPRKREPRDFFPARFQPETAMKPAAMIRGKIHQKPLYSSIRARSNKTAT